MELNQLGRIHVRDTNNSYELLELLLHANGKKRRKSRTNKRGVSTKKNTSLFLPQNQPLLLSSVPPSLDSLYILIRENPWICSNCIIERNDDDEVDTTTSTRRKEIRFLSRMKRHILRR